MRAAACAWFAALWMALATTAAAEPVDRVFAHPAGTAELAELTRATAQGLEQAKVVRGRFIQRRYLAGLTKPLESSGMFLFAREAGIEWRTEQPFESQFVLTDSGITQRDEGEAPLRLTAADQPALAVVARVFFALFALDLAALSRDFELSGEPRGAGWAIGLKPRGPGLAGVFRQAVVTGRESVERVVLEDGNGDRSEIDLRDVQYDRAGLTTDERRRF